MTALERANTIREHLRDGFIEMLIDNEQLFNRFELEANKVWRRGIRHYSARTIIEVLRHHDAINQVGSVYKINNNMAPDFARLYIAKFPQRLTLFELRRPDTDEFRQRIAAKQQATAH